MLKNRDMIEEVRAEVKGNFEEVWENITKMRAELQLVPYAAMEMSRREHEERLRAEQDPRGKRHKVEEQAESSDDE
ncbi:hypothetical protein Q3G72_028818 [Acer saccharum]|nr:hypothetical protein Q3G72_028818 [Acer saccharum]